MCANLCEYVHVSAVQGPTGATGIKCLKAGVTGTFEPSDLGVGNETRFFCKSSLFFPTEPSDCHLALSVTSWGTTQCVRQLCCFPSHQRCVESSFPFLTSTFALPRHLIVGWWHCAGTCLTCHLPYLWRVSNSHFILKVPSPRPLLSCKSALYPWTLFPYQVWFPECSSLCRLPLFLGDAEGQKL